MNEFEKMDLKRESTEKLNSVLDSYKIIVCEILFESNQLTSLSYHKKVFLEIIQRLYYNTQSINILLNNFNKDPNFKFSIGILARSCILDCISFYYLREFIDESKPDKFSYEISRLDISFVKACFKESLTQPNIDFLLNDFPNCFNDNGILNDKIQKVTTSGMVQHIQGQLKSKKDKDFFELLYNIYVYYSNYEHYGTVSKKFLETDPENDFTNLLASIFIIIATTLTVCDNDHFGRVKVERLKNLLDEVELIIR